VTVSTLLQRNTYTVYIHNQNSNLFNSSPSLSLSDLTCIVWHPPPVAPASEATNSWSTITSERQLSRQVLRKHSEDVYDVSWSPCSTRLITGSVDNKAVIWDVARGKELLTLDGHSNFVQGVSWDPAGQFIVTQSNDRTARVWKENVALVTATLQGKTQQSKMMNYLIAGGQETKMYKCIQVIKAIPAPTLTSSSSSAASSPIVLSAPTVVAKTTSSETTSSSTDAATTNVAGLVEAVVSAAPAPSVIVHTPITKHHLFIDEGLVSFFRRPSWTPDGSLLIMPAGMLKTGGQTGTHQRNTSFVFRRGHFDTPIANLSAATSAKPSIGIRASPVIYRLRSPSSSSSSSSSSSAEPSFNGAFSLAYRMIIAVATLDAIFIYDTQTACPIAAVANMHCDKLTDLTWSQSGNVLLFSSIDGYCSEVTFDEGELGEKLPIDDPLYPSFLRNKKHCPTFLPPKVIVRKEKTAKVAAADEVEGASSSATSTSTPAKPVSSASVMDEIAESEEARPAIKILQPKRKVALIQVSGPGGAPLSSSAAAAVNGDSDGEGEQSSKRVKVVENEDKERATVAAAPRKNAIIGNDD